MKDKQPLSLSHTPSPPQDKHLGKGTRTNIYSGTLKLKSDEDGFNTEDVPVVLKVIGAGLKDVSVSVCVCPHCAHNHLYAKLRNSTRLCTSPSKRTGSVPKNVFTERQTGSEEKTKS